MWCVAELDPDYIAKMEDLLALYERPYNAKEPVVCLDESPVSLHAEVRPPRPARPGHIAKHDTEYKRCGTANIFGVVEPKAGRHFTTATPNRSARQFARVIRRLVWAYPAAPFIWWWTISTLIARSPSSITWAPKSAGRCGGG
jgi:hypothetical protein